MNISNEGPADFIYHIVYKTTNLINGFIYIGIHSTTELEDGYLGSGKELKRVFKEFGKENFKREILFQLDSREAILLKEEELVNKEFLERNDVYNRSLGGQTKGKLCSLGKVSVKHSVTGECRLLPLDDPRYISGEYIPVQCGKAVYFDVISNKNVRVSCDDPRISTGELQSSLTGKFFVRYADGDYFLVTRDDPRYINNELLTPGTGRIVCSKISEDGTLVSKSLCLYDPLYLSGEWKPLWCFKKHTQETKSKIGEINSLNRFGSDNSQFGTRWMCNIELKINRKINKNDPLPDGWVYGNNSWNKKPKLTSEESKINRQNGNKRRMKETQERRKAFESFYLEYKESGKKPFTWYNENSHRMSIGKSIFYSYIEYFEKSK